MCTESMSNISFLTGAATADIYNAAAWPISRDVNCLMHHVDFLVLLAGGRRRGQCFFSNHELIYTGAC